MNPWSWLRPPQHLLALFLIVTLIPGAALVWLGWHLLEQETVLGRQRVQDWLDRSANLVTAALQTEVAAIERSLTTAVPPGGLRLQLDEDGVTAHAGAPLLFAPKGAAPAEPPAHVWSAGEMLEFSAGDLRGAAAVYRGLAESAPTSGVRVGALLRLARALKRHGDLRAAAAAYEQAANLRTGSFHGDPAELVARAARCELLARLGEQKALLAEATAVVRDLTAGRWRIDRVTYLTYAENMARWTPTAHEANAEHLALSNAIDTFWRDFLTRRPELPLTGRRLIASDGTAVLLFWQARRAAAAVMVVPLAALVRAWETRWQPLQVNVALLIPGAPFERDASASGGVVRTASATGLPWDVHVTPAVSPEEVAGSGSQRRALLAGLALLVFVVPAGGFIVARAVRKEMAVARLQKDFVSAVSHELRSPLTTMAHMTEMLSTGRVGDEQRRRQYYDVLSRETERLKRFVETLLDFGRMEAGTLRYAMDVHDPGALVDAVAEEFRADAAARSCLVRVAAAAPLPSIRANRDAFGRALWNLLDNAAKYSPPGSPIDVEVAGENGSVAIRVRDQGSGVPAHEHERIFQQFVRGSAVQETDIKGTGVGLAMARQVVTAHGGEIHVQSELGCGSTFSIVLPAADAVRC